MKLEDLEPLLQKVQLVGAMPSPKLRMSSKRCKVSGYAHAHCRFGVRNRGLICFSNKGLNRERETVIMTLAHELAHLRFPTRAHRNKLFIDATIDFYNRLNPQQQEPK